MMKLRKTFLVSLMIFSIVFSNIAMADTVPEKKDQGDAIIEYTRLLETFANTKNTQNQKYATNNNNYPEYYAGAYLDNNQELVILVTDKGVSQNSLMSVNATFETAKYSLNTLNEIMNTINSYVDNHRNEALSTNISGFGIDEKENRVLVSFTDLSESTKQAFEDQIIKSDAIAFEQRDRMETNASALGSQIYYTSGSTKSNYSIGFRAQRIINGVPYNGFITSGHDMKDGSTIISSNYTSVTSDGMTVKNTVLANYSATAGDSGGIVYMIINGDAVPAGIHRGSGSAGSSFCKVQSVIDALGVTPY